MRMRTWEVLDDWGVAAWLIVAIAGLITVGALTMIGEAIARGFEKIGESDGGQ